MRQAKSAVLSAANPMTAMSLAEKGYSRKLGAGLTSMAQETRRRVTRTGRAAPRGRGRGRTQKYSDTAGRRTYRTTDRLGACKRCPAAQPILDKSTCQCYTRDSDAARKQGICPDKRRSNGRIVHFVAALVRGSHRCLIAGGKAAKQYLGNEACPPGKALATVRRSVPLFPGSTQRTTKTIQQCVRPRGKYSRLKDCPQNQVLVEMPRMMGRRCVMPSTATKRGYRFVSQGTLPIRHGVRRGTVPQRLGR